MTNPVHAAARVTELCTAEEFDGVLLDVQTANAILVVYKALSPKHQTRFEALSIERAGLLAWKAVR